MYTQRNILDKINKMRSLNFLLIVNGCLLNSKNNFFLFFFATIWMKSQKPLLLDYCSLF